MKWEEVAKIVIVSALSIGGGSYVTHNHDTAKYQEKSDQKVMSCSEVIQLVIENTKK